MSKDERDIDAMNTMENLQTRSRLKFSNKFLLAAFLAVATVYLISEHADHALAALPYLVLLLCPLMHFFMHRGGHGAGHNAPDGGPTDQGTDKE